MRLMLRNAPTPLDHLQGAAYPSLAAIAEHSHEITDREVARRIAIVRVQLEGLQQHP